MTNLNLKQKIYSSKGNSVEEITLSADIFGKDFSRRLVSEVVVSLQKNARSSKAHTKDRSQVRGGGRKPWRQKGTGRARHGSIRSPIWKGGGVTHGPTKDKKYYSKINKKVRVAALKMTLSAKLGDGEIILIDNMNLKTHKTKDLISIVGAIMADKKTGKTAIVVEKKSDELRKASGNIPNLYLLESRNLNVLDILSVKYLIMTKAALENLVNRLS